MLYQSQSTKFNLKLVAPPFVSMEMPHVQRLLDPSRLPSPFLYSWTELEMALHVGKFQLWLGKQDDVDDPCCFMLTELIKYPQGNCCNILLVGGSNLRSIARAFFSMFLDWCKAENVQFVEAVTVPGVARMLKRFGFIKTGIRVTFPLSTFH